MVAIGPWKTNLPGQFNIYAMSKLDDSVPYLKVGHLRGQAGFLKGKTFSISISDDPRLCGGEMGSISTVEWQALTIFVKSNQAMLLRFWIGKQPLPNLYRALKKYQA